MKSYKFPENGFGLKSIHIDDPVIEFKSDKHQLILKMAENLRYFNVALYQGKLILYRTNFMLGDLEEDTDKTYYKRIIHYGGKVYSFPKNCFDFKYVVCPNPQSTSIHHSKLNYHIIFQTVYNKPRIYLNKNTSVYAILE